MKKTGKIITFILLGALCVAAVAVAAVFIYRCASGSDISRYLKEYPEGPYYKEIRELTELRDCHVRASTSFTDNDEVMIVDQYGTDGETPFVKTGVYDFTAEKFVLTPGNYAVTSRGKNIFAYYDNTVAQAESTYTIITRTETVASGVKTYSVGRVNSDVCRIEADGRLYFAEGLSGKVTAVSDTSKSYATLNCSYMTDEFIVGYNLSDAGGSVNVYSRRTYEFLRTIKVEPRIAGEPYCDKSHRLFVLGNGNIVCQYTSALPDGASDYDFAETDLISSYKKKALVTLLVNISDGSVSEKDVGFVLGSVINGLTYTDYDTYYANADNKAVVYKIKEKSKALRKKESTVFMNNELEPIYDIEDFYPGADGVSRVTGDLYMVTVGEERLLADKNGKAVTDDFAGNLIYGGYLRIGDTFYDYDRKNSFTLAENETIESVHGRFVTISKRNSDGTVAYGVFDGKSRRDIPDYYDAALALGTYSTYVGGQYKIYSVVDSSLLFTSEEKLFRYVTDPYAVGVDYAVLTTDFKYYKAVHDTI